MSASATDAYTIETFVKQTWRNVDRDAGVGAENLYTPDGEFVTPAGTARGRTEIAEVHASRTRGVNRLSRHVLSNLLVSDVTGGRATADYVVTLYAGNGQAPLPFDGPQMVFDVRDDVAFTDTGWLVASRRMEAAFVSTTSDSVFLREAK